MTLGRVTRYALILLPLIVCAGRVHAHRSRNPQGTTQDINRCLTVVRVAASRRKGPAREEDEQRREALARASASHRYGAAAQVPIARPA